MSETQNKTDLQHRNIKSYVIRAGRMTQAQIHAIDTLGEKYLIKTDTLKPINFQEIFGNDNPVVLEIGFGMGKSFIQMAIDNPDQNFLGIEVHPPGIGATLMKIEEHKLPNVKIISHDAFEILTNCIQEESIDFLQIFFPDPWPKARHHKRRLINDKFIALITPLLKHGGQIRLATDWENYAEQMLDVMSKAPGFINQSTDGTYIPRPSWRPLTKFEQRGQNLGHGVWDLVFTRE